VIIVRLLSATICTIYTRLNTCLLVYPYIRLTRRRNTSDYWSYIFI